jgi:hypothetical protein
MIELALVILIIIIIFTEFIKYIYKQPLFKCEKMFSENALFSRARGKNINLH